MGFLALFLLAGCAHLPTPDRPTALRGLAADLAALAPAVEWDEAWRAAACAHDGAQELAREYRVVRPPLWHNSLVNLGFRDRGLCYHWAEDLMARLQALQLTTLQLRWGEARVGTLLEHNCVVLTARGQPFDTGVVLDAWRQSGRLYWVAVRADRYRWRERR